MSKIANPRFAMAWRVSALAMLTLLAGCDRMPPLQAWVQAAGEVAQLFARKPLPDPVQSKDGVAYIPIDDTAFLVPEKTWLRGFARNSTDGLVGNTLKIDGQTVSGAFSRTADMGGDIYYSADKNHQLRKVDGSVWRLSAKNAATGQYAAVADLKGWKDGDYGLSIGADTAAPDRIDPVVYPSSVAYLAMDGSDAPKGVTFGGGTKSDSFNGSNFDDVTQRKTCRADRKYRFIKTKRHAKVAT